MNYEIAVIGGGPGGYTAAAKAAKEGFRVVLFERDLLGGTCLNRGCIPTKALIHAAETYSAISHSETLGISVQGASYDFSAMHRRKDQVVLTLRQGVEKLMKSNKVTVVSGSAQVTGPGAVSCGGEMYEAEHIILASGSKPSMPPIPGIDLPGVYSSNDLLEGEGLNLKSLIVIGGGVIGVESASIYLPLGTKITILEAMDHILPNMDRELAQRLTMSLKKQGAAVEAGASVTAISGTPGAMTVTYRTKKGKECTVTAEGVLVATGRRAETEGLFAPGCAPELERGAVTADAQGRTSIPNLYVIGDARARNIQLAHVAIAQAENVVALIAGKEPPVDEAVVPSCIFTSPEAASVGLTEAEAKAAGHAVRTLKSLTGANGKCLIEGAESGFVKLVTDADTGVILGAQLICPRATDLVGELALAVERKLTAVELAAVIHAHPTFHEMIASAAELW